VDQKHLKLIRTRDEQIRDCFGAQTSYFVFADVQTADEFNFLQRLRQNKQIFVAHLVAFAV